MARILLIEDEAAFRAVLAKMLVHEGHEVFTASNGREAQLHLDNASFDLVITDVLMPEKDGVEIILSLKRTAPGLKVIAMSGGGRIASGDYLAIAARLGASATLEKPFTRHTLLQTLQSVLPA